MTESNVQLHSEVTFLNSEGVKCVGALNALSRRHVTMELYHPDAVVQLSEVLTDLQIKRNGRAIYRGRAVVSSLIDTAMTLLVSASLVDAWQDLTDAADTPGLISEEARRFIADWEQERDVDPRFRVVVGSMRSLCYELSRWLTHVDTIVERAHEEREEYERNLLDRLSDAILPTFQEKLLDLEDMSAPVFGDADSVLRYRHLVQRELHPLLLRSPWLHRTYSKPLGFAGDFEMVNMMVRSPYEGPSVYAKMINRLFLETGPVHAHRNRLQILYELLKDVAGRSANTDAPVRILNIGCGPAIEIQNLLRFDPDLADRCEFVLMDFSADALEYTQKMINQLQEELGSKARFHFIHQRVQGLLKRAAKARLEADMQAHSYDLCYCAGLFDYLGDKTCKNLVRFMLQLCRPGASIVATNVHPAHKSVAIMEFLMEWSLIYRDEKQMADLLPPGEHNASTYTDSTGINVFLQAAGR